MRFHLQDMIQKLSDNRRLVWFVKNDKWALVFRFGGVLKVIDILWDYLPVSYQESLHVYNTGSMIPVPSLIAKVDIWTATWKKQLSFAIHIYWLGVPVIWARWLRTDMSNILSGIEYQGKYRPIVTTDLTVNHIRNHHNLVSRGIRKLERKFRRLYIKRHHYSVLHKRQQQHLVNDIITTKSQDEDKCRVSVKVISVNKRVWVCLCVCVWKSVDRVES